MTMNLIASCAAALASRGEEGLMAALFDRLGVAAGYCVEFGAKGHGPTWHLRHTLGWKALLLDAAPSDDPAIVNACVTAENINELFAAQRVPHNLDFLCIDIDSNDYWVWRALDAARFQPRVVCIEYNCFFPPDVAVTVAYNPDLVYQRTRYYGASAAALYKLAQSKGYGLVCVQGFMNMFFVRNELLAPDEQNVPLEAVFHHPVEIEAFARQQGYSWRPSWIKAPPPDLTVEKWVHV